MAGGAIGVARYSIEDDEKEHIENKHSARFLAHFILNAAIGVVGGVITKFSISPSIDAILAGGIVTSLIGYSQVRRLLFDAIIKKYNQNRTINNSNNSNGTDKHS